jgi:hypothetical protein
VIVDELAFVTALQAASGVLVSQNAKNWFAQNAAGVVNLIESVLGWALERQTFTDYLPAYPERTLGSPLVLGYDMASEVGRGVLQLPRIPVRSVTSVYENPDAWMSGDPAGSWPDTTLLSSDDYLPDWSSAGISWSGLLTRSNGLWSYEPRGVKVTYVAGLTPSELNSQYPLIKNALLKTLVSNYSRDSQISRTISLGGVVRSVSVEDFSVTFTDPNSGGAGRISATMGDLSIPKSAMGDLARFVNYGRYFGR